MPIVLGLAAQNTLGSLISGIALLVYRPFRVGDRIQVTAPTGVETGIVENVTLGYTVIQTVDNRRVVLPNSLASSQTSVNLSSVNARIMAANAIVCPVIQLGASSVRLSVRAWCHDAIAARNFEWGVYALAKAQFEQAGIELPYPYQNVIVKKESNLQEECGDSRGA